MDSLDLERALNFDVPRAYNSWDGEREDATRFDKITALDHGTWIIVNDKNQFYTGIHGYFDEWDNLTGHGVSWSDEWDHAYVFFEKRAAERKQRTLPTYYNTAVVG